MENEMIERVARAVIDAAKAGAGNDVCGQAPIFADIDTETALTEFGLQYDGTINMVELARAAIEALRTPTQDMILAAEPSYPTFASRQTVAKYTQMIDAALERDFAMSIFAESVARWKQDHPAT